MALAACTGPDTADRETSPAAASGSSTASLSSALPWPAAPTSTLAADRASKMVAEMQRWVDKELMPGATAAVVSPEGTWAAAVGVDGQGTKLEPTSGLALGQVTQTFVAAEALLLAEQGKLDLDAPAASWCPSRSWPTVPRPATCSATGPQCPSRGDPYAAVFTAPDTAWSAEQFLSQFPRPPLHQGRRSPRTRRTTSWPAWSWNRRPGRTAADAIKADLWTPLGLQRLAYQDAQQLPEPIAAPGEDEDLPNGQTGRPYLPFRSFVSAIAASHGVAGDAASVATWGYDLYGGQILKPASVAQLIDFDYPDGRRFGMATIDFTGRNWDQYSIDGYGMRAATPGYRSVLAVYPPITSASQS